MLEDIGLLEDIVFAVLAVAAVAGGVTVFSVNSMARATYARAASPSWPRSARWPSAWRRVWCTPSRTASRPGEPAR